MIINQLQAKYQECYRTLTTASHTWVVCDRTVTIFHVNNPGRLFPTWAVLHFKCKHSANLLNKLRSLLQQQGLSSF